MRAALPALAALSLAASAHAQERGPAERQSLTELAYTLGEAHALRRVCAGPRDGAWYGRMQALIGVERPDAGLNRRLVEAFNAGFVSREAEFRACVPAARAAERAAAAHGRVLAKSLARP